MTEEAKLSLKSTPFTQFLIMKYYMKNFLFGLCLLAAFASCRPTQNIPLFSYPGRDSSHMFVLESYDVPIQTGDQLSIVVSALNPISASPYNYPPGTKGIVVDQEGNILYPQLGSIKVAGLTRIQLRDVLIGKLKTYLTDPVVNIEFNNFKVTVLGEVSKQGTLNVADGKINIVEAIAQAGDFSPFAKKHQVEVIREINGKREFGWVNLYSTSVFTTPYYRLRQNDIIYVHPIEKKPDADRELNRQNLSLAATILGVLTTLALVILQLTR